ncbi:MAG: hydrogenase expression/formation protein [Zoogloeaceae bacterium]|jgi:hydrogenase-1 operon protein HyaF|nr:hydrogenase expression/formation protein [Zoogloeaceae bacterium]
MTRAALSQIPVVMFGAGSQPAEEDWNYLPLPREVDTFHAPLPEQVGKAGIPEVLPLLRAMIEALQADPAPHPARVFDVAGLSAPAQALLAQSMGEGEVSAQISLPDGGAAQIQESVYTGIWRVLEFDAAGALRADRIEIGDIAPIVVQQAMAAGATHIALPSAQGQNLMNAPAIANEIASAHAAAMENDGASNHAINFSLLPVTPEDLAWLEKIVGGGPVGIFSRGYGKCVVTSTGLRHVWRVRYFDGMNKIMLDMLEITRVPEVVLASREDLVNARAHLQELLEWLESGNV